MTMLPVLWVAASLGALVGMLGGLIGASVVARSLNRASKAEQAARRSEIVLLQRRRANAAVAAGLSRLQSTVRAIEELQFARHQDDADDISAFQDQLESSIHELMESYHRHHAYLSEDIDGYFGQLGQSLIDSPAYAAQLVCSEDSLRILRQNCGQGLGLIKKEMRRLNEVKS